MTVVSTLRLWKKGHTLTWENQWFNTMYNTYDDTNNIFSTPPILFIVKRKYKRRRT